MAPPTDTLPNTPPPPAEAPPPAADAREQVRASTQDALNDLKERIKEKSDFGSSGMEKRIEDDLRQFFDNNRTDAPEEIQQAWRDAVVKFMAEEIKAYNWSPGTMDTEEVRLALAAVKDPGGKSPKGQTGIGSFEQWINKPDNPHKTAYEKWKAEKDKHAAETQQKSKLLIDKKADFKQKLDAAKKEPPLSETLELAGMKDRTDALNQNIDRTESTEDFSSFEEELASLKSAAQFVKEAYIKVVDLEARLNPEIIVPVTLLQNVRQIKNDIATSDGRNLPLITASIPGIDAKVAAVEELKPLAENPDIPEARKNEILALVREGKKDPTEAKKDLEAALQGANLPVAVDEDAPIGDRLLGWAGALPDGPMKKIALGLASFFATLCTTKWIGGWFRGKLMSNRTLAEKFGDAEAAKAVKVEQEFRRFGLPENLVADLGKKKTKEVLALLRQKPDDITKDTVQQGKLAKLADNIETKGGATSDDTLVDFMSNGNIWKDIVYPGAALAVAVTPAPTPGSPESTPEDPNVITFTDQNFENETKSGITVVDFYADWCAPCKQMAPAFREVAVENRGSVKMGKLNIDQNPNMKARFNIENIPATVFLRDGKEITRLVGVQTKDTLAQKLLEINQPSQAAAA